MGVHKVSIYLIFIILLSSLASASVTINTFLDNDFTQQSTDFGEKGTVYLAVYNGVSCCDAKVVEITSDHDSFDIEVRDDGSGDDDIANDGIFKGSFDSNRVFENDGDSAELFVEFTAISSGKQEITAEFSKPETVTLSSKLKGNDVELSWDKSDDISGIDYYIIYKSRDQISNPQAAQQIITYSTEYTDKNLEDGQSFYYAVAAVDRLGNIADLSNQKFIAVDDELAPIRVENLDAEYRNNAIKLTWDKSFDNSGDVDYIIYRDDQAITKPLRSEYDETGSNSYIDSDLEDGKEYFYAIVAVDASGNEAEISEDVSVIVDKIAPEQVQLDYKLRKDGDVVLFWNLVDDAHEYHIYKSTQKSVPLRNPIKVSGESNSYTDTISREYYYQIAAVDDADNLGDLSNRIYVEPDLEPPQRITNLKASALEDGTISLSWDASTSDDILAYKIYRSPSKIMVYSSPTFTTKEDFFLDSNTQSGTTYRYVVRAMDESGNEDDNEFYVEATAQDSKVTLDLFHPQDKHETKENLIVLGGQVEPSSTLAITVNGREVSSDEIVLDKLGYFLSPIELTLGSNVVVVDAVDKENNAIKKTITVYSENENNVDDEEKLRLLSLIRDELNENSEIKISKDAVNEINKISSDFAESPALSRFTGYAVKEQGEVGGGYVAILLVLIVFLGFYLVAYNKEAIKKGIDKTISQKNKKNNELFKDDYFDNKETITQEEFDNEFY